MATHRVPQITYSDEAMALWPGTFKEERTMREIETIELSNDELKTVSAGMLSIEPFVEAMKAQQAIMTSFDQVMQGISDATKSAINKAT
jgi:hypothetical protein